MTADDSSQYSKANLNPRAYPASRRVELGLKSLLRHVVGELVAGVVQKEEERGAGSHRRGVYRKSSCPAHGDSFRTRHTSARRALRRQISRWTTARFRVTQPAGRPRVAGRRSVVLRRRVRTTPVSRLCSPGQAGGRLWISRVMCFSKASRSARVSSRMASRSAPSTERRGIWAILERTSSNGDCHRGAGRILWPLRNVRNRRPPCRMSCPSVRFARSSTRSPAACTSGRRSGGMEGARSGCGGRMQRPAASGS